MTIRFSSKQLRGLASTLDVAARPFHFGTPDQWRAEVLRHSMALFEAKAGHFDIVGVGAASGAEYVGYASEASVSWQAHWRDHDDAMVAARALALTTYTRRARFGLMGSDWEQRYRRSPAFQEFYVPYELAVDAAGLHVRDDGLHAHLHVDYGGSWSDQDDARAQYLMAMLHPVLAASVRALHGASASVPSDGELLDSLNLAVAVIDGQGRWQRCSAALSSLLAQQDPASVAAWRERVTVAVRSASAPARGRTAVGSVPSVVPAALDLAGWSVTLVPYRGEQASEHPIMLLQVHVRTLPLECPTALAPWALTSTQWAVARLVASGYSNQQIADALGTSVHTSRRHLEAIMGKSGIASRAGVASAVWQAIR